MAVRANKDNGKYNKAVDWDAIEPEWRAGIVPKSALAEKHGVSRQAIEKHFAKLGIERGDLGKKIRAKAREKVVSAEIVAAAEVEAPALVRMAPSQATRQRLDAEEGAIVEKEAALQAAALTRHQQAIARAWAVVDMLMAELAHQTQHVALYEELGVLMYNPDEKGVDKLAEIYRKAMTLPTRSSTVKTLLEALKTAIALEREALGMNDRPPGGEDDPIAALVRALQGTALKPVSTIPATKYTSEVEE